MGIEKAGLKLINAWAKTSERSLLATRHVKVNPHELGFCHLDGTVKFKNFTRYRTAHEAEAEAKRIVMKQFEAPVGEQKEIMTATVGNDLYVGMEGSNGMFGHECYPPAGIMGKKAKLFHNHPVCTGQGDSNPVSCMDISAMLTQEAQSITAFNRIGQYCTAELKNPNKILDLLEGRIKDFIKAHPEQINASLGLKAQKVMLDDMVAEIDKLKALYRDKISEKSLMTIVQHISNKRILPQLGIEYKTNFSNLLDLNV